MPQAWPQRPPAHLLERAASVFQAEARRDEDQTRITELEQLVGRLTPEKEIPKKASLRLTGAAIRNGN